MFYVNAYVNIATNISYIFPIVLVLCLMLSVTYYTQNYAGTMDGSLMTTAVCF